MWVRVVRRWELNLDKSTFEIYGVFSVEWGCITCLRLFFCDICSLEWLLVRLGLMKFDKLKNIVLLPSYGRTPSSYWIKKNHKTNVICTLNWCCCCCCSCGNGKNDVVDGA